MTIAGEIDIVDEIDGARFTVRTRSINTLIGNNGQNLSSFSHIVKKISEVKLRKAGFDNSLQFSVDVNDYQLKKTEELKSLAKMNAQRVRYFKKEIILPHMNSYERRIIHTALAEYPDIKTESIGEGEERRIVIKPL
ncbi:MAG: hypothetical protein NUV64_02105 [Parcubacteria group bacterium]|nr:hypothetical protein [Parcubacteria group bacterium]MCR4342806.1 hypothetical protein [Patescibacteria group bacterium]